MLEREHEAWPSVSPPLVSVIVPAYNAETTLPDTVDSIQRQSFRNFELIVINDGSTDGTLEWLQTVRDDRLRVFNYPNGGLAVARNRGIERVRGEFISFIDSDDLWTPDKLALQLEALRQQPEAALAYSWTAFVDQYGDFLFVKEASRCEGDVYAELLRHCFVANGSNILVRTSCALAVGGFDTALPRAADWDFCLRVAARWRFAVVPRYQILYRISERAMSADAPTSEETMLRICDRAFDARPQLLPKRDESLANVKQYIAFLYLTRAPGLEAWKKAGQKLAECIRLHPRTLLTRKTWYLLFAWSLLQLLPVRGRRPTVITLLRIYGRWSTLWRPEVQRLVEDLKGAAGGRENFRRNTLLPDSAD
jgi:glycosyltransferase involved in cell wall biosynthesis